MFLKTTLAATSTEFWAAFDELGAIYFIRDKEADAIKVGYSRDPQARLSNLQVGSSRDLELIGVVAAPPEVEAMVHRDLFEGRMRGEWFHDRGVTSKWLQDMTQGHPMYRHVWRLVPGQQVIHLWDATRKMHTKHTLDPVKKEWVPPLG